MEEMLDQLKNRLEINPTVTPNLFLVIAKINRINHDLEYDDKDAAADLVKAASAKKWIEKDPRTGNFLSKLYEKGSKLNRDVAVCYENSVFLNRYGLSKMVRG